MARRIPALVAAFVVAVLPLGGCATADRASSPGHGLTGTVTVYAAASLSRAFDEIGERVESDNPGVRVRAVYDGSSTLAAQILEGAPADVFASADEASMASLAGVATDPAVFATNTLVIATPADNPAGIETLADLTRATVVLCAPEVPCGAASDALLERAGVTVTPASLEQNVTAVLTKVAAGEADAGLVYATDVRGMDGVAATVPEGAEEIVNRYPIATIDGASHPDAAATFVAFVRSAEGERILARHGFGAP